MGRANNKLDQAHTIDSPGVKKEKGERHYLKVGGNMAGNKYNETQEWWLRSPETLPENLVEKHIEMMRRRESRRLNAISRNGKTDDSKPTTKAQKAGRGFGNGIITECGRFLEVWISPESVHVGNGTEGQKGASAKSKDTVKESQEEIARRVNHRARKQIRRIVNTNDFRIMYTLTIAPPSRENNKKYCTIPYEEQKDYSNVRRLFHNFLMRMRKAGIPLSYVAVFELHNSEKTKPEKRGCWHIHLATNLSDSYAGTLEMMWQHGCCDVQDYKYDKRGNLRDTEITNPGAYMAKYIGKGGAQFGHEELRSKRRYTTSRDVKRPQKALIGSVDIGGSFDTLEYRGKVYALQYYHSTRIPGTEKLSISATYMEVRK